MYFRRVSLSGALLALLAAPAGAADVVGILKAQTANEHGALFADAIIDAGASQEGLEFLLNDAENDIGNQISQAETMINRGAKVLAVEPVSAEGSQVIAEMAGERGVKVFTFNSRFADPSLAESFVGADNESMGRAQMQFTVDKIGGAGNVVILHGAMGHGAQIGREVGYREVLAGHPDVKIIREGSADWTADRAVTLMENYLQSGEAIDAVVAQNDDMANGAAVAAADAGKREGIVISGIDGLSLGIGLVADGSIDLSVEQGTECQVERIVQVAAALVAGEAVEDEYVCEANLITSDNVSDWQ